MAASRDGFFTAAHDVSSGGLAMTLVEMASAVRRLLAFPARLGGSVRVRSSVSLRAESRGRAANEEVRFPDMCEPRACQPNESEWSMAPSMAARRQGLFTCPCASLRATSEGTFPCPLRLIEPPAVARGQAPDNPGG